LGGKLNYDAPKRFKSANESVIALAGEFPKCKGLYPDCPEEPSLMNSMCRTCPKTDGMKKPKLITDEEEDAQNKKDEATREKTQADAAEQTKTQTASTESDSQAQPEEQPAGHTENQ